MDDPRIVRQFNKFYVCSSQQQKRCIDKLILKIQFECPWHVQGRSAELRTRQLGAILTVTYKRSYKVVLSLSFIFLYLRCETDTDLVLFS